MKKEFLPLLYEYGLIIIKGFGSIIKGFGSIIKALWNICTCNILITVLSLTIFLGATTLIAGMNDSIYNNVSNVYSQFSISEKLTIDRDDLIDDNIDISNWLYFITALATAILAFIAYNNFNHFNDINKHKYLLQIDKRWSDPEIIKARQIIHVIYRAVCDEKGYENKKKELNLTKHIYPYISQIIIELSVSSEIEKQKAFIYLLNYLDFMESIAFLYKEETDEKKLDELNAFCGDTLIFNYGIFYGYIKYKNRKHSTINSTKGSLKYYENFHKLVHKIKKPSEDIKTIKQIEFYQSNLEYYEPIKGTKSLHKKNEDVKKYLKAIDEGISNII